MDIQTVAQFAKILLALATLPPHRVEMVEGEHGYYAPLFTAPTGTFVADPLPVRPSLFATRESTPVPVPAWYTIRPELAVTPGAIEFLKNAGQTSNEYETFLCYTVCKGLGYGAKLTFSDNERDVWGNQFIDCVTPADHSIVARRLLIGANYRDENLLRLVSYPIFAEDELRLRELLRAANLGVDLREITPDAARTMAVPFNDFFDALYLKFKEYQIYTLKARELTKDDPQLINRLKQAYKQYLIGFVPALYYHYAHLPKASA